MVVFEGPGCWPVLILLTCGGVCVPLAGLWGFVGLVFVLTVGTAGLLSLCFLPVLLCFAPVPLGGFGVAYA